MPVIKTPTRLESSTIIDQILVSQNRTELKNVTSENITDQNIQFVYIYPINMMTFQLGLPKTNNFIDGYLMNQTKQKDFESVNNDNNLNDAYDD